MKSKVKNLIRNVLIGAVASIYHTNAQAAENSTSPLLEGLNGEDKKDAVNALNNYCCPLKLKGSSPPYPQCRQTGIADSFFEK